MTKEMAEALKSVFDVIMYENPNAIRATIEIETPGVCTGVCTVEVESEEGIILRRL